MPRNRRSSRSRDDEIVVEEEAASPAASEGEFEMQFTQQQPELSQPILPVRQSDRNNLESMGSANKKKAITDLSRLILFKALAGEPIDRLKCTKEALADFSNERITSAAWNEAAANLENVFGFQLKRVPKFMEERKHFPSKFKDRYYVMNGIEDTGAHSKAIHSVHSESAVEKGLLMIVLAFCFCKGEPRSDGSRWITDVDLYRLLRGIDENIPEEPPAVANRKVTHTRHRNDGDGGVAQTPDVDSLLIKFTEMDYLLKEKVGENAASARGDQDCFQYSMGPRAAMEIGRRQVVYFCAEILDEEPDPTMLAEIENNDDEEEEEDE